jgi:hypothetical protein
MDKIVKSIVSSVESVMHIISQNVSSFMENNQSENFWTRKHYPAGEMMSSDGGDDSYSQYRPYLAKREFSSRLQHDNHRWPISSEMVGPMEQTLRSDMVLPCDYKTPEPSNSSKLYASF